MGGRNESLIEQGTSDQRILSLCEQQRVTCAAPPTACPPPHHSGSAYSLHFTLPSLPIIHHVRVVGPNLLFCVYQRYSEGVGQGKGGCGWLGRLKRIVGRVIRGDGVSGPLYPNAPSVLFCAFPRPASPTSSTYTVGCPSPT